MLPLELVQLLRPLSVLVLNLLSVAIHRQLLKRQPGSWRKRLLVLLFGALQLPASSRATEGFDAA